MKKRQLRVAIAGNPNCGKSTLFNFLTKLRQHVGNWPGKTVERKEGRCIHKGTHVTMIDLPGTYSLNAYSIEEIVARDYILEEAPDVVINVVDASHLERNLYLTIQLLELSIPVVIALNMNKLAKERELDIDIDKLSLLLNVPIIKIEANDGTNVDKLLDITLQQAEALPISRKIMYGEELHKRILELTIELEKKELPKPMNPQYVALRLLEHDKEIIQHFHKESEYEKILFRAKEMRKEMKKFTHEDMDIVIADARYGHIAGVVRESVKKPLFDKITTSENIDRVLTNKYVGIPIFLLIMFIMFQTTFTVGAPFVNLINSAITAISNTIAQQLTTNPQWLQSLVIDGIMGGVGSIIIFLPNILILFLFISFLEDTGYMARVAFLMDKVMHKIGLHGKSFIPLIIGFGCNVPAIMATRTLNSTKDRIMTILIIPFMSCSARLPVYVLFAGVFFPKHEGMILFSLYILGIIIAVSMGLLFKQTLFKGLSSPFVMELPPYRMPTLFGTIIHMWDKGKEFLTKAGTVIFSFVLIIWFLANLPIGVAYASEQSYIGIIGKIIAPIFQPMGFGFWQAGVALLFGVLAKEVVVSTFGTLYGVGNAGLGEAIASSFTPLSAYAFMVFVLLYIPCVPTLATIKRETGSWKWMLFASGYLIAVAWIVSFLVYTIGKFLGFQ